MSSTNDGVATASAESVEHDVASVDEKIVWVPGLADFDITDEKDYIGSVAFTVEGMPVKIVRKNGGRPSAPLVFVARYNCKTDEAHPLPSRARSRYPLKSLRRAITKEAALRALSDIENNIADLSKQVEQLSLLEGRLKSAIDQADVMAANDSVETSSDDSDDEAVADAEDDDVNGTDEEASSDSHYAPEIRCTVQ